MNTGFIGKYKRKLKRYRRVFMQSFVCWLSMAQMKEINYMIYSSYISRSRVTTIKVNIAVKETPRRNPNIPPTQDAPITSATVSDEVSGFPLVKFK